MCILSQVLLLAGIAAISTSAAPATSVRPSVFPERYIIVLREFQNYTGGPLPSSYNSSRAIVQHFLRRYSMDANSTGEAYFGRFFGYVFEFSAIYALLNRHYPVVGQYSRLYIGFVAELNDRALQVAHTLPQVYFIEKEQTYHMSAPEWHLDRIDQSSLPLDKTGYCPKYTGRCVDIYILDSGIRYSHSEFRGRAKYGGFDFQLYSAPNGPGSDCNGHGTHVAALAGGSTVGVAREATLYSIRMIGCDGRTSTSTILRALEHVVEHKNPLKTVIMSMSFGVPVSASINLCVSIAHWNGIIPVASAGNNEFNSCRKSPASATHAFTVGATDRYDKTWHKTNYGRCVNIFAPGADIRSASDDSDYGYTVKSGTSMAAPLVSGAAAVILDRYPNFKPKQVMSRLINRSTKNKVNFVSFPFWATLLTPNRLLFVE
jgi:proprotein convertase subtilisin/kexin type 9